MSKKSNNKYPTIERIDVPRTVRDKDGNAILMCPFCEPSHALNVDNNSSCGTLVQIRAVQTIYKAKYDDRLICVRCGEGGKKMVRYQNGFLHTHKCKEGVLTLATPPTYYKLAEWIFLYTPEFFRKWCGAIRVDEVFPDGKLTGVILGYTFFRGSNGRKKPTTSTN